jgi:hypothetical protein
MNRRKRSLMIVLFWLSLTEAASGCSLVIQPVTKFDPSEYVFAGEVVGYVGPRQSKHVVGDAWGLLISPGGSVHLPETPAGYFEVFPYGLGADCLTLGTPREELAGRYPVGSKVNVIARESKLDVPGDGNIRLVGSAGGSGSIMKVDEGEAGVSMESAYDYRRHSKDSAATPWFELRKDLLRLRDARTAGDKLAVLKRLVYFPPRSLFNYAQVVGAHLADKEAVARLITEREAWLRHLTTR